MLCVVAAAFLATFILLASQHQKGACFLVLPRFWVLSAGGLLFLLHRTGCPQGGWQRRPSLSPLVLLLLVLVLARSLEVPATIAVVGLTVAVLSHPWALGIGPLSYSLDLWHWTVRVLSRWMIGIALWTLPIQVPLIGALAMVSYCWVDPSLRPQRRCSGRAGGLDPEGASPPPALSGSQSGRRSA